MSAIMERALRGESLAGLGLIDFHVHLGKWSGLNILAHHPEEIVRRAMALGLERIVVNGVIHPQLTASNDLVGDLVRRYPGFVIGLAVTNPYQHDMAHEVRRCFDELGMRGVKLHAMHETYQSPQPLLAYREQWERLFAFLSDRGAPVLYHGIVTEDMIRSWPDVPFVMAHGVSSPEQMVRLSRYPNFHVDTASTQNPYFAVTRAVSLLGASRVIWGTDAPWDDFAQRLGVVLDTDLPVPDLLAILGRNAARLLRLEE
ncbi:MAG: amidohydrolase family protein [Anaerolineae bacterium]|nr:amidohydrolase family protein [Anaerolineae bacterium]